MSLRNIRRWMVARARDSSMTVAPRLPSWAIDAVERGMSLLGPCVPVLPQLVASNMRAAGVFSSATMRQYFEQVALHLSNALRVFQSSRSRAEVQALVREQVLFDDSLARLHAALAQRRGVVLASPHINNYVLNVFRLADEAPVCVYLRWSKDRRKRELKEAWCRAGGVRVILEESSATDPTRRAARCVELLQAGNAVIMTPDIAQKTGNGVDVRLFGRTAHLPTGPASIAMLAEAPMLPVFARVEKRRQWLTFGEPVLVRALPRAEGGRRAGIRASMQTWTDQFEAFLRACPQGWFLWGDGRWTRFLRNDPKYCGIPQLPEKESGPGSQEAKVH